jgi:hypothetical protein
MPHADVAFVHLKVAQGKAGRLYGNPELLIAPQRSALAAIGLEGLHWHADGYAGAAMIAAGAIQMPTTATKPLVREVLVAAAGDDPPGVGKQCLSIASVQV